MSYKSLRLLVFLFFSSFLEVFLVFSRFFWFSRGFSGFLDLELQVSETSGVSGFSGFLEGFLVFWDRGHFVRFPGKYQC